MVGTYQGLLCLLRGLFARAAPVTFSACQGRKFSGLLPEGMAPASFSGVMEKQVSIRDLIRGLRNFLISTSLVTNFLALFLVASLLSLLAYTVIANPIMTTAIIGFSSGIIGAITGFYFNKDQLNAVQREQLVQGIRANDYAEELQALENRHAELTASY